MEAKKITMYRYLAERVPADVHFVLNKYDNYRKANSTDELEEQIKHFVRTYGENAIKSLSEIHPDKELIESNCSVCHSEAKKDESLNKKFSEFFNADGKTDAKNEDENSFANSQLVRRITLNTMIVGGFILMGIALIIKNKKD